MADHESTTRPNVFQRFLTAIEGREIVVVRGLIVLAVSLGLIWGFDLTEVSAQLNRTLDAIGVFVQILGLGWIRGGVAPYKEVEIQQKPDGTLVAGPASGIETGTELVGVSAYPVDDERL